uniref:Late embryogenesis abundant protein LEA-2 subgroup domain-containing protein n=1 Tax=Oryza glumipatula TaxID=40148 RepID=A0A0E0A493_9ORYZ
MGGTTAADGGGSRTLFRCIKTARYVVAVTVMVLIVVVISYAIKMVVRERSLLVKVAGSTVNVQPLPKTSSSDKNLSFSLTIRASNPSGFSKIYYTNITALLIGKINASLPATSSSFNMGPLPDLAVQPRTWMFASTVYHASIDKNNEMNSSYNFTSYLYNGYSIRNAVLRLNGTLSTEVYNYHNHSGTVIYCCSSIFVGDGDDNPAGTPDMPCREQHITGLSCD